jgi:endonuclease/exonuclease/phosphatase (EEP) superfamily protein YafD
MRNSSGLSSADSPRARRLATLRRTLPWLLTAAALVHPLASLLARYDWRADLLTHFQEPAFAVSICAVIALAWRHRILAVAFAVLALFQLLALMRYEGRNPVPADPYGLSRLHIVMANVMAFNEDHARLAEVIQTEKPDIVGLVEVTRSWIDDLADVRRQYPYRVEVPIGSRGLALWFRQPPLSIDPPVVLTPNGNAVLHAQVQLGGRPRHLWLVHPPNPLDYRGRHGSNSELTALATRISQTSGSKLVIGDLNRTDGSPFFREFLRISGLRDSRLGFGRQPSWPVWSPYRIAIDHAFLSSDLAVVDRRLGPDIGSDHFPLIVDVAPGAEPISSTIARTRDSRSSP